MFEINYRKIFFLFFIYLLRNPFILYFVVRLRYYCFKFTRGIRTIESQYSIKISNSHNLEGIHNNFRACILMERFDRLMFSMLANEKFNRQSKILIIGPRTEGDIFKLKAYGYSNIEAIDLISYSSSIHLMDCHNMTFLDNTFDAIICGWVLPYSINPEKIADNITRVAKNKALIAVGIVYTPNALINSTDKIKLLFKNKIENIFFEYDACLKDQDSNTMQKNTTMAGSQIMISFDIKK
jgi:hypothetical protein